jgi:predicted nuclease of predicted toxin-antitoxin system
MRFKTDENVHPAAAALLRTHGHDATTVWDQGLRGRPDGDVASACLREDRALVTMDVGFADIMSYPPERYRGLIVLRLKDQGRRRVLEVLSLMLPMLESERLPGRLWIVDDSSVRVRGAGEGEPSENH